MLTLLKGSPEEEKLQAKANYAGIAVVGAGLPRTGTLSTRAALAQLLDGKVYHMNSVGQGTDEDFHFWSHLFQGGKHSKQEWRYFFQKRGFRATLDNPAAIYYREILEAFPDAKVLLTVREPASWYASVADSIYVNNCLSNSFPFTWIAWLMGKKHIMKLIQRSSYQAMINGQSMFGAIEGGCLESERFYTDWVQSVVSFVPPDKLLVYSVKEGWEPLCKFLSLPVPQKPFPNVNDTQTLKKYNEKMAVAKFCINYILLPVLFAFLLYLLFDAFC